MDNLMYFQELTDQEDNNNLSIPDTCTAVSPLDTCVACGAGGSHSGKKRPIPYRERHIPLHPSSTSAAIHHGFTRIPLPPTSPAFPPLRRCTSDPVSLEDAPAGAMATPSPVRAGSSGTRGMSRSVSAPERDLIAATDRTGESPNSKRLKRIKERMIEMSKWCDQVIAGGNEDDHLVGAEVVNNEASKDKDCEGTENEEEEAVSVENNGDCLIIHLKCPCKKAYQFLLSHNNCYYKLI